MPHALARLLYACFVMFV